jgi:hypothetical protein
MMFQTATPAGFSVDVVQSNGDTRLQGPPVLMSGLDGGPVVQLLRIMMLPNERPDLAAINDRAQMAAIFANDGWTRREHPQVCVDWYQKDNGNTRTDILVWGGGHGVILTAILTPDDVDALEVMAARLQVGACGWN